MEPASSIGEVIYETDTLSEEFDDGNNRVYVEALLHVGEPQKHLGSFTVDLVTKDYFLNTALNETFADIERPEMRFKPNAHIGKKPYVLNDHSITEEVLTKKFIGRVIREDLAASLWEVPEDEPEEDS